MPYDATHHQPQPVLNRATAAYRFETTGQVFSFYGIIADITRVADGANAHLTSHQAVIQFNDIAFAETDEDFDAACACLKFEEVA